MHQAKRRRVEGLEGACLLVVCVAKAAAVKHDDNHNAWTASNVQLLQDGGQHHRVAAPGALIAALLAWCRKPEQGTAGASILSCAHSHASITWGGAHKLTHFGGLLRYSSSAAGGMHTISSAPR